MVMNACKRQILDVAKSNPNVNASNSKFYYHVAFLDDSRRLESILLDVLNEECHYEQVLELPIDSPFLNIEGTPNKVKVHT